MPVYPAEPSLGDHLNDHDLRLQALESSPQLGNSSVKGGALVVYDDTFPGNIVGIFGAFTDSHFGTVHGLVVKTPAGQPLMVAHDLGGVLYPYQQWGWWEALSTTRSVIAGNGEICTSVSPTPTWEGLWTIQTELVTATYVKTGVRVITPAGSAMDVRMVVNGGAAVTSTKTIGASTDASLVCYWAHGLSLASGPLSWEMQVRVGGAGPVTMFRPKPVVMTDWSTLAVAGGWV